MKIDMTRKPCKTCKKGEYIETSLFDDMDGVLHCSACNTKIKRYEEAPEHYVVCADGAAVLNAELWQKLDDIASALTVSWHWVKGYAGHSGLESATYFRPVPDRP